MKDCLIADRENNQYRCTKIVILLYSKEDKLSDYYDDPLE